VVNQVESSDSLYNYIVHVFVVVDGYFSGWSSWSQCTQTCGSGVISRDRTCNEPTHGGKNCSGLTWEKTVCTNPTLCPGNFLYIYSRNEIMKFLAVKIMV
jgi:hypothetical protein